MNSFEPLLDTLPAAQQTLWPRLRATQNRGFVLYGGTAIALRLGHRVSVDFDFCTEKTFVASELAQQFDFIKDAQALDAGPNLLTVICHPADRLETVKLSFFGAIDYGRVGEPSLSSDGVIWAASFVDLMATKLKVLHDLIASKDYLDLAALIEHGVSLPKAMAAARLMYGAAFDPAITLKAMTWFKGGDMDALGAREHDILIKAAASFHGELPAIERAGFSLIPDQTS